MPSLSSIKRWLVLTAAVLLAHLALMGMVSDSLTSLDHGAHAETTFVTRTVAEPVAPAALVPSEIVRTNAKPQPQKRPAPVKPALQDGVAAPTDDSSTKLASTDPVPPDLPAVASPPEPPASKPEVAAAPPTPPAPTPEVAQAPEVTHDPHAKPLYFNPASLSGSTRLIYTLTTNKFPLSLNAELLWRNLGDRYSARLHFSAFGRTRMQTSQGRITATGLAPERFTDKYRSEVAAHFDEAQGKISFSANTPDAPLLAGAQDRLSVLIQLGALLASDPTHLAPGSSISVQTVGPRNAELWLFTVMQTEALELPGGKVQGVKLERLPREPYDQKVEVWLSPQLAYLPVRIRITEANGDHVDQQWHATESAAGAD